MATLLFVHGTGVRGPSFDASFAAVKAQAAEHLPAAMVVEACRWGDDLGATQAAGASAVPNYVQPSAEPAKRDDERASELRWGLLYDDPLYELRTHAALAAIGSDDDGLGGSDVSARQASPAKIALDSLAGLLPSHGGIARSGHYEVKLKAPALRLLAADGVLDAALRASSLQAPERRLPVLARAFVGAWARAADEQRLPALDGELRDSLYQDAVAILGGSPRGIKDELLGALGGLATRIATPVLRWNRSALSDASFTATNDILLYQTPHGGSAIRGFIARRIGACAAPVYLLAHSLGGIACVELLAAGRLPGVAGLITCGSQAPFLYASDALSTLRRDQPLPGHFPKWLNVFDLNDMLSYSAAEIFQQRATDLEVRSRQPFPQSHSAYWTQAPLWHAIEAFTR